MVQRLLSTLSPKNIFKKASNPPDSVGLLSTLSPKNCSIVCSNTKSSNACCPHYPPKTRKTLDKEQSALQPAVHTIPQKLVVECNLKSQYTACCPHYPPKTDEAIAPSFVHHRPAVHTIPQKPRTQRGMCCGAKCLLSTLSPKNHNKLSPTA